MAFTTVIPAIKWNDNWVQLKEMLAPITGLLIDWPPTFSSSSGGRDERWSNFDFL
jgi:hypothetical protein